MPGISVARSMMAERRIATRSALVRARVGSIDETLVSDYDEPRRRLRLRAAVSKSRRALWVDLHPALADAIEQAIGPREDRIPDARIFAARAQTRCARRSARPAGRRRYPCSLRMTFAIAGSRCCTSGACPERASVSSSGSATWR
jgi:hypothetical protein